MPRPGPRPYECLRRPWHSDNHKPMRGSIIQQILRFVYERHSSVTKKNGEWQIKLPIVVLRAEEIMYSKANSEAEYADPETLWDRVNDAIGTIIRRDESTETGQLLPPCVEAALNLGCIAEKTARSQRNSNPRNYLSPRPQESCPIPPKLPNDHNTKLMSPQFVTQPTFGRPENVNLVNLASDHNKSNASPSAFKQINQSESNASLNLGSAYPLYYGTDFQPEITQLSFKEPQCDVIIGRPIYPSNMECDLSLRLGMSSANGCDNLRPNGDSQGRGKFVANNLPGMHECWWNREGKDGNAQAYPRKRKMSIHENGYGQVFW